MATEAEILKTLQGLAQVNGTLFFQHVKTGTSWGGKGEQLRILDGLAVKISWTRPEYHGYEIKVSRGDFLRDTKYTEYLPYCSAFSFVVPSKIVKKEEVPAEAGLIYYKDGTLHTVKKAPALVVDDARLLSMLRYLVYYRTGSRRHQIAAAVRQLRQERQRAAQEERTANYYAKLYRKASNKLYELGYRGFIEDD